MNGLNIEAISEMKGGHSYWNKEQERDQTFVGFLTKLYDVTYLRKIVFLEH